MGQTPFNIWEARWNTLKAYMEEQDENACEPGRDDVLSFSEVLHVMKQVEEMETDE